MYAWRGTVRYEDGTGRERYGTGRERGTVRRRFEAGVALKWELRINVATIRVMLGLQPYGRASRDVSVDFFQ